MPTGQPTPHTIPEYQALGSTRPVGARKALAGRENIVMTEWGAEGRPELAAAPPDLKGGYPFQTFHAQRTIDVIDRSPVLSGAIYWTLREFEIYPGWRGGAGKRGPPFEPNTRHNKGLITYEGRPKPVYGLLRDRFHATPLYP